MTDFGRRAGDMFKSTYDTDADGTVDDSEKLEASSKAQVQDHTPKSHAHAQADVTNLATALAGKSDTGHGHTESDISDLDHDALKVKGVIVNDAAIGDQKVLAYDLATERIVYIEQAPSGATIKSIQQVSVTIPSGTFYKDKTITSVDISKAALFYLGQASGSVSQNNLECYSYAQLTNSTTVRVTRNLAAYALTARFVVVEWNAGIESLQRGVITMTGTETTATINTVDTSKSFVRKLGQHMNATPWAWALSLELTNSTTVTARSGGASTTKVSWEVLEFSA